MTDVRLTATNPEDSSVVPVACNAKGELLLEETPAFDGNVDGDLTVSGSATFAGGIQSGGDANGGAEAGARLRERGLVQVSATAAQTVWTGYTTGTSAATSNIYGDGSAAFAGAVNIGDWAGSAAGVASGPTGYVHVRKDGGSNAIGVWNGAGGSPTVSIDPDGGATFAGSVESGDLSAGAGSRITSNSITTRRDTFDTPNQVSLNGAVGAEQYSIAAFPTGTSDIKFGVKIDGTAEFAGEVVVGSRSKKWMLLEQGGLCHMVEQQTLKDGYPELRNVLQELDLIEKALGEVMEKLRMSPPSGWEVWDGSSENS